MKRTLITMMMLVVVMMAAAQRIASQDYVDGTAYLFLEDGRRIAARDLPAANYRSGYTIEQCIAERQYELASKEARRYRVDPSYDVYGYGAGMYGGYMPYGSEGSSFSIGNSHWGVSTSSSNYGGYKRSSTGIRVGSFHIGTSGAKYEQPTYATRGTSTSSASYQAQKKADAKRATRYSQMRSAGVVNGSTTTNTSSTTTAPTGMWNY